MVRYYGDNAMNDVSFNLSGTEYSLYFNGHAMFALKEEFGEDFGVFEAISPENEEGLSALCKTAEILMRQGELLRRYQGYDNGKMINAKELSLLLTPAEATALFYAASKAIMRGYGREIEDDSGFDEVLAEIQKKTGKD